MASDPALQRYRHWYANLLRLYARRFRARYGEAMEQTFADLLRERAQAGKNLPGYALWMFMETFAGIVRENTRILMMENKSIVRVALGTAVFLILPLLGMTFGDDIHWGPGDFLVAGALLFGTGMVFELVARKGGDLAYRAAACIAVVTTLLLVWVNLAVGIIGDEENLANLLYLGVIAIGFFGALMARFKPRGMARALLATAAAQILVGIFAVVAGWGIALMLNTVIALLWIGSALLFRRAGV